MSILNRDGKKKFTGMASFLVIGTLMLAACGPTATPTTTTTTTTVVPGAGSTPTNAVGVTAEPTLSSDSPTVGATAMMGETPTAMMMGETPTAMMTAMMGETPEAMTTPGAVMQGDTYMVTLNAQNGSGQSGTAMISDMGNGMVHVVLDITPGSTTDPQPAHIHKGTCANLDANPAYPLSNVVEGKSVTDVEANFADLVASPYAINIHKSAAEATTYVSCGDITKDGMMMGGTPGPMAGETPEAMGTPGAMMGSTYTVKLAAQNGSGQDGTAIITDLGNGKVDVKVDITANGVTDPQPAHIHKGTCANLDPSPAFPLTNVVGGKSETDVDANFADLVASPYAINIHKSAAEATTYVSCGDITTDGMTMSGTPSAMTTPGAMMGSSYNVTMKEQNGSGQSGKAVITDLGGGMVKVMVDITANGVTDPQPAHIHQGTCAQLDAAPAYPLTNVVGGKSETDVEADFDTLTATAYAINVHKSAADASVYVSCGDITTDGMMMGETPTP